MEPSLKNGDILLVRKADFPGLRRFLLGIIGSTGSRDGPNRKKSMMTQDIVLSVNKTYDSNKDNDDNNDDTNNNEKESDGTSNLVLRNRRLREYEYQDHVARESSSVWFRSPPWPMKGQIVTYRSPYQYPTELCIKRVVGVAGQVVGT